MMFDQIVGHQRQKELLQRALQTDRVAQAYLFDGPEGVGKRLMALALTRALFCETLSGCGDCAECRKVDHNNHPDLHILEAEEKTLKIEQIRDLQRELSYRPLSARRKICLLDGADRLNVAAGNALLKTLEEPPGHAVMILLTAHSERLLPTIRSRCQRIPFGRLPYSLLKDVLLTRLGLTDDDAHLLAALSEGSLKRALGKDRDLYLDERPGLIRRVIGLTIGSVSPLVSLAQELADDKDRLAEKIEILQAFYRDVMFVQQGRAESELVNADLLEPIHRLAKRLTRRQLLSRLDALETVTAQLERNANRQLAVEVLLQKLV